MNYKKILFSALFGLLVCISFVSADFVFSPQFGEARFEPSDSYHAGCLSEGSLSLSKIKGIGQAHIVLNYNPDELHVTQLRGEVDGSFHVGYDQLVMDFSVEEMDDIFAMLQFKSQSGIEKSSLVLDASSYLEKDNFKKEYLDTEEFLLVFSPVPECEPDVVSPNVNLLSPREGTSGVALDSYFVFDIKDQGKGIDKKSIFVSINDKSFGSRDSFKWSGSYLFFFPDDWLPVGEDVKISVSVSDLQKYGGANSVQEDFFFRTATGVVLSTDINPNMMRLFKQKAQSIYASDVECALMNQLYSDADSYYQYQLKSLMKKMECKLDLTSLVMMPKDEVDEDKVVEKKSPLVVFKGGFSVFAIVGWIFFVVTLLLKLHYVHGYYYYKKKHKNNFAKKKRIEKGNPLA